MKQVNDIDYPKVCLIIPCYNEAKRIDSQQYISFLTLNPTFSLLFVNDGSTDQTLTLIQEISNSHPRAYTLSIQKNMGKGESIRFAVLHACSKPYDFIGYFDADLSSPLAEGLAMLAILENTPCIDYVMGARIAKLGNNIRREGVRHYLGRVIATFIDSFFLKINTYDTQCGAKLMRSSLAVEVFKDHFTSRWLFDVEILARIISIYGRKKTKKMVFELPLRSWTHQEGSKLNVKDVFRIPLDFIRIKRKYGSMI